MRRWDIWWGQMRLCHHCKNSASETTQRFVLLRQQLKAIRQEKVRYEYRMINVMAKMAGATASKWAKAAHEKARKL